MVRRLLLTGLFIGLSSGCLPEDDGKNDQGRIIGSREGTTGYSYGYPGYSYSYYDYTTTDSDDFGPANVIVELSADGVVLQIAGNDTPFMFGMIESGVCGDDCWVAEGCYEDVEGMAFCHDAGTTGVTLTRALTVDEVSASETTLFSSEQEGFLTFVLDNGTDCYTWGSTPGYYIDRGGCTVW